MSDILKFSARFLLLVYKFCLSPVFFMLGIRCRHWPSCSAYVRQAITHHGVWAGGWMSLARLSRCHPFGSHGIDNVPEHVTTPPFYAPWRYGVWHKPHKDKHSCSH